VLLEPCSLCFYIILSYVAVLLVNDDGADDADDDDDDGVGRLVRSRAVATLRWFASVTHSAMVSRQWLTYWTVSCCESLSGS